MPILSNNREPEKPGGSLAAWLMERYPDLVLPPWHKRGKGFGATICGCELFVCPTKRGDRWCVNFNGEWFGATFETREDAMAEAAATAEGVL